MKRAEVPPSGTASSRADTPEKKRGEAERVPVGFQRPKPQQSSKSDALERPRLRDELRFLHDGAPLDAASGKLPGRLRVIDPQSGRQFDFTAQEHVLCRSADGAKTIEELHDKLKAQTDTPLSTAKIERFFRRLQFNGLLVVESKDAAAEAEKADTPEADKPKEPAATDNVDRETPDASDTDARPRFSRPVEPGRRFAAPSKPGGMTAKAAPKEEAGAENAREKGATGRPRFPRSEDQTRRFAAPDATADSEKDQSVAENDSAEAPEADMRPRFPRPGEQAKRIGAEAPADTSDDKQPAAVDENASAPDANMRPRFPRPGQQGGRFGAGLGMRPGADLEKGDESAGDARPRFPRPGQQGGRFGIAAASQAGLRRFENARAADDEKQPIAPAKTDETSISEPASDATRENRNDDVKPGRFGAARIKAERPADEPVPEAADILDPAVQMDRPPRNARPIPAASDDDLMDFFDEDLLDADDDLLDGQDDDFDPSPNRREQGDRKGGMPGSGMRGKMGGGRGPGMMGGGPMGGGMMGGGPMGGGMMGGGMMGGGPMAGGMMGGGMMGGGPMAGGMMGGRGGAAEQAPETSGGPAQLPLMNPTWLLRSLYVVGWPLKFFFWALVPLAIVAGLSLINNIPAFMEGFRAMSESYSVVVKMLMAVLLVNLSSRLAQGVAIIAHGGEVKVLGVSLILGILPRFYIDTTAIDKLDRSGQLWAYGAPLLTRLFAFSAGMLVWAITKDGGGSLPIVALIVAKFGLLMFGFTAWPLFPADGMRWMSVLLNEPKLMAKSVMAFRHTIMKGHLPPMIDRSELLPLTLFAIGVLLTTVLLMAMSAVFAVIMLEGSLGGLGIIIFLSLVAIATMWFMALIRSNKARLPKGGQGGAMARGAAGGMAAPAKAANGRKGAATQSASETAPVPLPNRAKVLWALILCAGAIVAFMPYTYETGGEVEILPLARGQAVARTSGEIVEIFVREGDIVRQGDELARLSDWDQKSDVAIAEARLDGARAELRHLQAGAQPEEVALARAQLARAEANVALERGEVERYRDLLASETISPAALERAEAEFATSLADLEAARAKLLLVEFGATREEIEIKEAEVARRARELEFHRDELERTRIVASLDGAIVTPDLHLKRGAYLNQGEMLLEIEQNETVSATIAVPESDSALVGPGQVVRMRVRGDSATEVVGIVDRVSPVAEDAGYGRVVTATALFENPDGKLRSSMTGHAKIEGVEMRAWEAYLRSINRFVQIEVWSWIP